MTEAQNTKRPGALIAMSGGVDSSVAAWLMQQAGYDCTGITMRLTRNETLGQSGFHTCCWRLSSPGRHPTKKTRCWQRRLNFLRLDKRKKLR